MPRIIVQGVDPRFAERIDRRLADDKLDPIERGPIEGDRQFGAGQVSRLIPLGIAETDQELLWIDPLDYASDLAGGVQTLRAAGVNVSVYNLPLACSIDRYGMLPLSPSRIGKTPTCPFARNPGSGIDAQASSQRADRE
jgi:hypothetical protein